MSDTVYTNVNAIEVIVTNIETETEKIDNAAVDGLLGVNNSLAYKVHEIEKHFHNYEYWCGVAAVPNAEVHTADEVTGSQAAFALLSGASAFGNWVQLLGSADTPIKAAYVKYDLHKISVTTTDSTEQFFIQIVSGESAGIAAKLLAKEYTTLPYISGTNNNDSGETPFMDVRVTAGEKVWARCCCMGQANKTINFYFGLHEYIG